MFTNNFLKKLGSVFEPKVIYDIGANVLNWTKEAKQIWNSSEIIVFVIRKENSGEICLKEI